MRAVNLIPPDQRTDAAIGGGRSKGVAYAVLVCRFDHRRHGQKCRLCRGVRTLDLDPPVGEKLLPSMQRPASRYLRPDQRDFFYVTAR